MTCLKVGPKTRTRLLIVNGLVGGEEVERQRSGSGFEGSAQGETAPPRVAFLLCMCVYGLCCPRPAIDDNSLETGPESSFSSPPPPAPPLVYKTCYVACSLTAHAMPRFPQLPFAQHLRTHTPSINIQHALNHVICLCAASPSACLHTTFWLTCVPFSPPPSSVQGDHAAAINKGASLRE